MKRRLTQAAKGLTKAAKKARDKVSHDGWCWACDFGRHALGNDDTCPCCRNGHAPS